MRVVTSGHWGLFFYDDGLNLTRMKSELGAGERGRVFEAMRCWQWYSVYPVISASQTILF